MDLYIIGAGDVGGFIAYHSQEMGSYEVKGFLDDDQTKRNQTCYGLPVIGNVDTLLDIQIPFAVAIAIANPITKKRIAEKLKSQSNIIFPNFIHPTVWIGQKVAMGQGCIIYPGTTINYETVLGNFVTINMNVAVGHNCCFSDYTTLSPGVNCGGFTVIEERSFLGIGATTIQSVKVGKETNVGAGAVIIKDVPDGATVVGNPGRIIKP